MERRLGEVRPRLDLLRMEEVRFPRFDAGRPGHDALDEGVAQQRPARPAQRHAPRCGAGRASGDIEDGHVVPEQRGPALPERARERRLARLASPGEQEAPSIPDDQGAVHDHGLGFRDRRDGIVLDRGNGARRAEAALRPFPRRTGLATLVPIRCRRRARPARSGSGCSHRGSPKVGRRSRPASGRRDRRTRARRRVALPPSGWAGRRESRRGNDRPVARQLIQERGHVPAGVLHAQCRERLT